MVSRGAGAGARRRWLERNPVCWLIARDRWAGNIARAGLGVSVVMIGLSLMLCEKDWDEKADADSFARHRHQSHRHSTIDNNASRQDSVGDDE